MQRTSFNSDWIFRQGQTSFGVAELTGDEVPITLPHDAVRGLERSADIPEGANSAFYPGGYFQYFKTFDVPDEYRERSVTIEFDGVYRDAMVFINDAFAAQRPYGYSRFSVRADPFLKFGERNTIRVESRVYRDSRWYTGGGIYRDVHLVVADPVHLSLNGTRVTTPSVDDDLALVEVAVRVENDLRHTRNLRVTTTIMSDDGEIVGSGTAPVTALPGESSRVRIRTTVLRPALWSPESPNLYTATTVLSDDQRELDVDATTFGIRSITVDPVRGLRLNGVPTKLRGACVHHDMGVLGAASIQRAEERRIEILKEAGFNAIRSSHNPLSVAALKACDRIGMLVLDETFDMWTQPKTPFDYSVAFPEWWERDIESMVDKDFNHPSVIMYSIGNEIFEVGTNIGSSWGRRLAEKIRELDPTRLITNGVNGLVASMTSSGEDSYSGATGDALHVNEIITRMSEEINQLGASPEISERTEESHSVLDVAGLNYCDARYLPDRIQYPNRVVLGTETFPGRIDVLWPLVRDNPHVIGDFAWVGWDYLGEAGAGRLDYPDDDDYVDSGFSGPFPTLTAGLADIDITGHRKPLSYYREIVYGLRTRPYIAVHRPQRHGQRIRQSPWAWTDSVSSWSWGAAEGAPVTIDVYTHGDEVELIVGGSSLGRTEVGAIKSHVARFETSYSPGSLVAVAYLDGEEVGRDELRTAEGAASLTATADRTAIRADDTDLAYVAIELRAPDGTLVMDQDRVVSVEVVGSGALAGLGTGRVTTTERFDASSSTTFDGRSLAVIRPHGAGSITVTVRSEGLAEATCVIDAS